MHPNEVKITEDNVFVIMGEATKLGFAHVAALTEQIQRQNFSGVVAQQEK